MDRQNRRVLRLRNHVLGHENRAEEREIEEVKKLRKTLDSPDQKELDTIEESVKNLANAGNKELEDFTVRKLREMAKSDGISGYSNMNKDELVEVLEGD